MSPSVTLDEMTRGTHRRRRLHPVSHRRLICLFILTLCTFAALTWMRAASAESQDHLQGRSPEHLQVLFGGNGLEKLSFDGMVLEDAKAFPADRFHIWHMEATDGSGKPLTTGQYGWGENTSSRRWDPATRTWLSTYAWGSIAVQYLPGESSLDLVVTTTNLPGSGVVFDGASVYPLALHFPQLPKGFANPTYPHLAFNTTEPGVTLADFGAAEVAAVSPDASRPLYSGFLPTDNGSAYSAFVSGATPDSIATFQPHFERRVRPGETDRYRLSLRFAASGTSTSDLAADAYANWARVYPASLHWADRRAIGTVFLASAPSGDVHRAGGYPNNPRRYFNDSSFNDFDVHTPPGLAAFQHRVLDQARTDVANLAILGAQGAITWDIEGQQFPQDTSYVCAPDAIAQIAPEMESTVAEKGSSYSGMKLDDAYFKIIRDAGFRVGVCVRPQHFSMNADGTAQQSFLPTAAVEQELQRKIRFAHDRWGATLFYIDSTVDADRGVLPAAIFKHLAAAFPDSLLIPEESTPLYYAYTAPFKSFIYLDATGTDPDIYNFYPQAFSAVLINNVAPGKLAAAESQLAAQVSKGDVLMGQVDLREPNNLTIAALYQHSGAAYSRRTVRHPSTTRLPSGKDGS